MIEAREAQDDSLWNRALATKRMVAKVKGLETESASPSGSMFPSAVPLSASVPSRVGGHFLRSYFPPSSYADGYMQSAEGPYVDSWQPSMQPSSPAGTTGGPDAQAQQYVQVTEPPSQSSDSFTPAAMVSHNTGDLPLVEPLKYVWHGSSVHDAPKAPQSREEGLSADERLVYSQQAAISGPSQENQSVLPLPSPALQSGGGMVGGQMLTSGQDYSFLSSRRPVIPQAEDVDGSQLVLIENSVKGNLDEDGMRDGTALARGGGQPLEDKKGEIPWQEGASAQIQAQKQWNNQGSHVSLQVDHRHVAANLNPLVASAIAAANKGASAVSLLMQKHGVTSGKSRVGAWEWGLSLPCRQPISGTCLPALRVSFPSHP
jgi:hypothetical protein